MKNINCNLKKNRMKLVCRRGKRDAEFRIIIPKRDNSGKPIKPQIVASYIDKMNKIFGGTTTYPSVYGCYRDKDTKKHFCEEHIVVTSSRDFESRYNPELNNYTKNQKESQIKKDYLYVQSLAKKGSKQLGQDTIFFTQVDLADAAVIGAKKSKKSMLPSSRVAEEVVKFGSEIS